MPGSERDTTGTELDMEEEEGEKGGDGEERRAERERERSSLMPRSWAIERRGVRVGWMRRRGFKGFVVSA